jgi:hypothetical protein
MQPVDEWGRQERRAEGLYSRQDGSIADRRTVRRQQDSTYRRQEDDTTTQEDTTTGRMTVQ